MKTLKEYINESLLDDDILDGFDDTIINHMLNDKDSPLMKSFNLSPKYHELNIINDSLFVFGKGVELNPPFTHISNILPNIKNIVYSSSVIIKNHNNVFKNEYLADKIIAHSITINNYKTIDEVTISDNNIAIRLCKNKIYECHKTQTNDGWWLGIEKRS